MKKWTGILLLLVCAHLHAQAASRTSLLAELQGVAAPPELVFGLSTQSGAKLAGFKDWLSLFTESPEKLGAVSYSNEPLIAGTQSSITVNYELGMNLSEGARLAVLAPWQSGIVWQASNSSGTNFVSVNTQSNVSLRPVGIASAVPFSNWYEGTQVLGFEIVSGQLSIGDTVQFSLKNVDVPKTAGEFSLPVRFSSEPGSGFIGPSQGLLSVKPNRVSRLEVVAPSRVSRGEVINAQVLLKDDFGNSSSTSQPELDVIVNGAFLTRVVARNGVALIQGLRFDEVGFNQIEVRSGGGGLRAFSNPIVVQSGNKRVEWLDINSPVESSSVHAAVVDRAVVDTAVAEPTQIQKASLERNLLNAGGTSLQLSSDTASVGVALPFVPFDERKTREGSMRSVQIVGGASQFEWFANRFYQAGYRLGVSGGGLSPMRPIGVNQRSGLTAVLGRDVTAGISSRATYATTGAKIVMHATVNGAMPGSRTRASKTRKIQGWAQGSGPIDRIELIKNGELLATQAVASADPANIVKVSVRSSSEPFQSQRDLPRNGREWIGFVQSQSQSLQVHSTPGFFNSDRQALAQNGEQRVDFITWTHGGWSSFLVELGVVGDDDVIEVGLRAGHEDNDISPLLRPASAIPAARQMIPVFELARGAATREIDVNGYADELRFELIDPQAPSYVEFSFSDLVPFALEDYYYLRVIQVDDQVAWTSPVFVGGFDAP